VVVAAGVLAFAPTAGARPAMAAQPARSAGNITLIGSGSSAAQPYMQKLFAGYHQIHSNISFRYNPDGGNAGVQDVQAGRSQFAIQTRPPLPSDGGTTWDKLFLDGLCITVNSANHLSDISMSQLANIFLGHTTAWNQVAGSNLGTDTIDPIGRSPAAGTYTFFQQAVLNNQTQSSNVLQESSDGLVAVKVGQDRDAIGYVGLAHSHQSGEKRLTIGGVACNDANTSRARSIRCGASSGGCGRPATRTPTSRSSSIGSGPATGPASSSRRLAVPIYNQGF
jgi:phosphate transport system substrate-binding protein